MSVIIFLILSFNKQIMSLDPQTKLYEVTGFNSRERSVLHQLYTTNNYIVVLNGVTNEAAMPIQIVVDKRSTQTFEDKLKNERIEFKKYEKDYTIKNTAEETKQDETFLNFTSGGFLTWEHFVTWIIEKERNYLNFKSIIIARTYEKRDLIVLSLSQNPTKPAIVFVGGEEGRDWMSPTVILHFITELLQHEDIMILLKYYNFYFIPIFNPDGYVYSMEQDMFWSKNRKEFYPKKMCKRHGKTTTAIGVNIDRNWYFKPYLGGGDATECSSVYLGHKPLSEEEPRAVAEFLNIIAPHLMAFINIKGFGGPLITIPYADNTLETNNYAVVMEIIRAACEKVYRKYNSKYFYGTTARFFCNSADWIKKKMNIPITATIHLKYKNQHYIHKSQIKVLSQEVTTIVQEMLLISNEIYGPLFNNDKKLGFNLLLSPFLIFNYLHYAYII